MKRTAASPVSPGNANTGGTSRRKKQNSMSDETRVAQLMLDTAIHVCEANGLQVLSARLAEKRPPVEEHHLIVHDGQRAPTALMQLPQPPLRQQGADPLINPHALEELQQFLTANNTLSIDVEDLLRLVIKQYVEGALQLQNERDAFDEERAHVRNLRDQLNRRSQRHDELKAWLEAENARLSAAFIDTQEHQQQVWWSERVLEESQHAMRAREVKVKDWEDRVRQEWSQVNNQKTALLDAEELLKTQQQKLDEQQQRLAEKDKIVSEASKSVADHIDAAMEIDRRNKACTKALEDREAMVGQREVEVDKREASISDKQALQASGMEERWRELASRGEAVDALRQQLDAHEADIARHERDVDKRQQGLVAREDGIARGRTSLLQTVQRSIHQVRRFFEWCRSWSAEAERTIEAGRQVVEQITRHLDVTEALGEWQEET